MQTFTVVSTPADIVKAFPKASDLFKENKINFCCSGDTPLQETFDEQGLDGVVILDILNKQYEKWLDNIHHTKDWDQVSLPEIIDQIVHYHHEYLSEELPRLGDLVQKIYRVHGTDHLHLKDLHLLYNEFRFQMEEHILKEEETIFPLIKKYEKDPSEVLLAEIRVALGELEKEHAVYDELLKAMNQVTNGFTLPVGACMSYHITYERLRELEEKTFQHFHLENNILFKRF